jgi:regulatory protein
LDLLARREHSREELMRKLCGKGFERGQASAVVQALAQQGWVSDPRFAQQYVRERVARGFGPLRISSELKMRGVSSEASADALRDAAVDWAAEAARVRLKRFGPGLPQELREWARQGRFLQYRGFSAEHVRAALAGSED